MFIISSSIKHGRLRYTLRDNFFVRSNKYFQFCNYLSNDEEFSRDWRGAAIAFLLNFVGNPVKLCRSLLEAVHDTEEWDYIINKTGIYIKKNNNKKETFKIVIYIPILKLSLR